MFGLYDFNSDYQYFFHKDDIYDDTRAMASPVNK